MNIKRKNRNVEGVVREVSEQFYKEARTKKIKDDFMKSGIIIEPEWPKFSDYDYTKLIRISFKLIEEMNDLEIPFKGVGVDRDFDKPMFVVYLPRESRGEPVPQDFEGFKVISIIDGKIKFQ